MLTDDIKRIVSVLCNGADSKYCVHRCLCNVVLGKGNCIIAGEFDVGLIAYEIKKTFCIPALWAFIVLSLALNGLLILGNDDIRDYFLVENGIEKNVIKMRSGDEVINAPDNIFVGYDTGALEAFYVEIVKESPTAVEWIQRKYSLLQPRVEHLAQSGAALDHYAGNATYESHQFLFGTLMRAMLAESSICAMLIVLYLMGYEQLNRTEGIVCASPIGRRLWGKKLAAAMLSAEALYVFVVGMTLLFYFSLWDYSGIWGDSVSSRFNYLTDMLYKRPFLTWGDFTIGGYLAASLALGAALVAVFALIAAVCAMLFRNIYAAALVLTTVLFGGIGVGSLLSQCRLWAAYFITTLQPQAVWLDVNVWFTESGIATFVSWQETAAVVLNLALYGAAVWGVFRRFMRRDIV